MAIEFLNPYHFLPLQHEKSLWEDDEKEESYTGMISYEITTRTPLLVPGQVLKMDEKTGHPYKRFFTYDNTGEDLSLKTRYRPAIPGSEIRGVIRSIYETLTNSCLSMIDEEEDIARRVSDIFSPGLIRRTEDKGRISYTLLPAKKAQVGYQAADELGLKDGAVCIGKTDGRHFHILDTGNQTGYLLKGEKTGQKEKKSHYTMMYLSDKTNAGITLSDTDIKNLQRVLSVYDDDRLNKQIEDHAHWYAGYKEELDKFLSGKTENTPGAETLFPVYYSKVEAAGGRNSMLYLSPACITKEIYNTRIKDIITGYSPCRNKNELCPACSLFGMAGDTNEDSLAGKLRFTDVSAADGTDPEDYYFHDKRYCDSNGMVTLPELSMPKPSAAEFYLQMPENPKVELLNWNYDYYVYRGKYGAEFMMSGHGYSPKIMGRKYYWHDLSGHPAFGIEGTDEPKTKRNQTVQLVDSGKTFHGHIYFDKISRTELCRLVWICNISSLWEGHGYKIGGGKPLGLGSIEMRVTGFCQRTLSIYEKNIQYNGQEELKIEELFESSHTEQYYQKSGFSENVKQPFWMITKFLNEADASEDEKMKISYPIAFSTQQDEDSGRKADGYLWFSNNRADAGNGNRGSVVSRRNMIFEQHLDELKDLSGAQLHSTVKSEHAKIPNADSKTKDIGQSVAFKVPYKGSDPITATVTKKERGKKNYRISFIYDQKKTGTIILKKNKAENIKEGSKIKVRCTGTHGSGCDFELVQ